MKYPKNQAAISRRWIAPGTPPSPKSAPKMPKPFSGLPWEQKPEQLKLVELSAPSQQSISENLHVLIGSVAWRRASLNRLLRNISAQTLLPTVAHLVLDGTDEANAQPDISPLERVGVKVDLIENPQKCGAGSRWRVLDGLLDDDIVCNLDDDVGLCTNDYLAQHHEALKTQGAVCVGGYAAHGSYTSRLIPCDVVSTYTGPIVCLQAGAFSVRVKAMRGLHDMPLAKEMLGILGDDEGLIAAHLWRAGVQVKRINTPISFDPCAGDKRSQYCNQPQRVTNFRNKLRTLIGWKWR